MCRSSPLSQTCGCGALPTLISEQGSSGHEDTTLKGCASLQLKLCFGIPGSDSILITRPARSQIFANWRRKGTEEALSARRLPRPPNSSSPLFSSLLRPRSFQLSHAADGSELLQALGSAARREDVFSPCLKRLLSETKVDAFSPKLSGLVERFGARASSRSPSSSRPREQRARYHPACRANVRSCSALPCHRVSGSGDVK